MHDDFEIGRIVAVDTAEVTIELNATLKALTKTTYEGPQEVGRINSYTIIPVGGRRLVAMVTRIVLAEEAQLSTDRTMVTLPAARRLMKATLIGTIEGKTFTQGITIFPTLDAAVHLATKRDLDTIFDQHETHQPKPLNPDKPGFCLQIGESPIFDGYRININPDAFFGKHAAIIGSTGSGKSCTIAGILQAILERPEIKRTNIIVLDTNGEYRRAFTLRDSDSHMEELRDDCLYIPSDPHASTERFVIPYWLMNANDFIRLFRAKEGLQAPVLLRALRLARAAGATDGAPADLLADLHTFVGQTRAQLENTNPTSFYWCPKNVYQISAGVIELTTTKPDRLTKFDDVYGKGTFDSIASGFRQIRDIAQPACSLKDTSPLRALTPTETVSINEHLRSLEESIYALLSREDVTGILVSADQPIHFDRSAFLTANLETAMKEESHASTPGRVREACGPMFLRIRRFLEDPRFDFLFGQFPDLEYTLATFLRDSLGLVSRPAESSSEDQGGPQEKNVPPFVRRQMAGTKGHNIVIVDLSLLASEVLENVTALIGRLVLEFLQRLGDDQKGEGRGALPVVLVLEEAQNYISETRAGSEESISRNVFERIAREGRKFGLSLVVASQRPSELSKTVLSQCSSFIVHRLQNPEDLRYFRDIVPGIYGPLLGQLPALAPQTALVLGECVRAPALVKIRDANPIPRSADPKFYKSWTANKAPNIDVEGICATWEGKTPGDKPGETR